jgi:DNA polymerase-3 subunit beta
MKVKLPRQRFQEALAAAATLTGGRTTKPILGCVKLEATGDTLNLSATDGESALRIGVETILNEEAGQTVVAADRLLQIVREMQDIEIALEADDKHCMIRGEGSEFRIYVNDPADFPPIPEFTGKADVVLDGAGLRRAVALTLYAAARETNRYAINGVLWEKRDKQLFLVATDGRRLARAGCRVLGGDAKEFEVIVPAKALNVFERVFVPSGDEETWRIEVRVLPNQMLLRTGGNVLATALVEGHFPNYNDVIPKETNKSAKLDREAFYSAVRRAALLTTEDSRTVRLAFTGKELTLQSRAPEQGEAVIKMPVDYEGDPIEIGFNPVYLADPLRAVDIDPIIFRLSENTRPGILRGEDANEFLYVVMPVALS